MQKLDERVVQRAMRGEEVDLRRYWSMVYRRKWSILAFSLAAAAAAAGISSLLDPIYRASATVMIEAQQANVVTIQDVYGMEDRGQEYYQTQFEILKSRPLAEKVVKHLDLTQQPEYLPVPPPFWKRWLPVQEKKAALDRNTAVVNRYEDILRITPIPKTQLVTISYDAKDPALAAAVVNAHAQAFIESYMEAREAMTRSASQWMSSRVDELKQKLNESEQKLQIFKEREHLVDVDQGLQSLSSHELNELTTKLIEARRALSENRNSFDQVNDVRSASLDEKLAIPAINSDPLIKQFRQARATAELQVAELSKRYGPLHPKMKAAISERDSAVAALTSHIDSVMDSIKNQQDALQGQARAIASAMDDTKAQVQSIGRKESEYRSLMQEVDTNRQLFDLFYKRITETKETGDLDTAHARVIEPAETPTEPASPKKTLITALAFIAALIVGIVGALLSETLDNTLKNAEDVDNKLGLPLLGLVPFLKRPRKFGKHIGHEYLDNSDRKFGEAIRTLRTAVTLSNLDAGHKLVMVTSSVGDEGKTTIACNLALAFAQLEKVLLIDADMRRPSIANEFAISSNQPGLSALCARTAGFTDCIVRKTGENLDVLVAGDIPPNPQELLASQKFRLLLNKLAERYDRIIIDCPPVLPVSDALLLANAVSAAIYVVRADKTSVAQVKRGIDQLRRTRVDIIGIALNQTDMRKLETYDDYGGAYTGRNYTTAEST
ncbi:MAG TPA: polysaccharide biosynthesis tyrosine autokinase [Spongiibacteraceae bacterium]